MTELRPWQKKFVDLLQNIKKPCVINLFGSTLGKSWLAVHNELPNVVYYDEQYYKKNQVEKDLENNKVVVIISIMQLQLTIPLEYFNTDLALHLPATF